MQCTSCEGGQTAVVTRPKAVERDGRLAVIRDGPVDVCDNCSEVYLDRTVAARLDELFRRMLDSPADCVLGSFGLPA